MPKLTSIIECIPNFSTSDPKVAKKIIKAIKKTPETFILDSHSDHDHNRTVITFISTPKNIIKACTSMIKTAAELIDLSKHQGVHPRIGATDVCPLVPLKNVTQKECIIISKKLARAISTELSIPTHLYAKSAITKEKQNLPYVRNKNPKPDFQPKKKNTTAGATIVGVRNILIAFNINLKSNDIEIAKSIATEIRKLPKVRALGFFLKSKGIAQVSMNLLDYKTTPPKTVFQKVKALAKTHHTEILESELVGLIPKSALKNTSSKKLMLKNFNKNKILEIIVNKLQNIQ